jgi:ribosome maturation factor RimP
MSAGLEQVEQIVHRVAESLALELVEVEMRGGGKSRMLRITIDKPGGVTHDDCANLSREVSTILDVEDAVAGGGYTLEVSSPGLDRKLRTPSDFERFTGSLVKLMTRQPVNNNRHFQGRLERFADGRVTLDVAQVSKSKQKKMGLHAPAKGGAQQIEIEFGNIERANLVPEI